MSLLIWMPACVIAWKSSVCIIISDSVVIVGITTGTSIVVADTADSTVGNVVCADATDWAKLCASSKVWNKEQFIWEPNLRKYELKRILFTFLS